MATEARQAVDRVRRLQQETIDLLTAVRAIRSALMLEVEKQPTESRRVHEIRLTIARQTATTSYARIAQDIIDVRNRLVAYAPPQARVQRYCHADSFYSITPMNQEALEQIDRDLTLLTNSLRIDEAFY